MDKKIKKPSALIVIDRETGDKLHQFHNEVGEEISNINKKFNLNFYEMIGVLEAIIFTLHVDAMEGEGD